MKIYLTPTCYGSHRIYFYELDTVLTDNNWSMWEKFNSFFKKMDSFSIWNGSDKSEAKNGIPSMKSWEVDSKKAENYFEYVQVRLEQLNVPYSIGY